MKQALLIIDVQNDYFDEGKMVLVNPTRALSQINQLEVYFTKYQLPIIYIQHFKEQDFFIRGTFGVALHQQLKINEQSIIIEKQFPNSFWQTNLQQVLNDLEVEQLVITGMMTHMCVDATTRAAHELDYQPIVISDATATKNLNFKHSHVTAKEVQTTILSALQTVATILSTTEFISNN